VFSGLRTSELRGLTWEAVDLERQVLTVRQRADRWNTIGLPKSDPTRREIPLAPIVVNTLRAWKLPCPNGELNLVFPTGEGNVERHANIHKKISDEADIFILFSRQASPCRPPERILPSILDQLRKL